jgi:hypothetical protein
MRSIRMWFAAAVGLIFAAAASAQMVGGRLSQPQSADISKQGQDLGSESATVRAESFMAEHNKSGDGAGVWMAKDYKQWDAKDVAEILGDSPWAKSVSVHKTWSSGGGSGTSTRENVPTEHSVMYSAPPSNAPSGAVGASDVPTSAVGTATFIVRWVSATTIRRADARNAMLKQHIDPAQADDYANQKSDTYDVAVGGPDMSPFASFDNAAAIEQLRQKVYIENKSASLHVTPLKAEVRLSEDGKTPAAVTFHFPKENADGSPVFAPNLKGVDFICPAGKIEIRTHFDFTKMITQQGRDL